MRTPEQSKTHDALKLLRGCITVIAILRTFLQKHRFPRHRSNWDRCRVKIMYEEMISEQDADQDEEDEDQLQQEEEMMGDNEVVGSSSRQPPSPPPPPPPPPPSSTSLTWTTTVV